jgi:hypothetical protein
MAGTVEQAALARDGFLMLRAALSPEDCVALAAILPATPPRAGGLRNALRFGTSVAERLVSHRLDDIASALMGCKARAVRAIVFDKTPESNWAVPWHQDLSIAVGERHDQPGYRAWSLKEGVWHAQPPIEMLEAMLTLRLRLDDCGSGNGPLRVLPGSHRDGKLDAARVVRMLAKSIDMDCIAAAGDVLAMKPLLLHASSKATRVDRRRVLHVEYRDYS